MLCHTFHQSTSRKATKVKSVNDIHVIVYLETYLQPKTIKIIYKIFTTEWVKNLVLRCGFFLNLISKLMTILSLKNTECCLGYQDSKGPDFSNK